jgi:glycerol dehydrogenase
MIVKAPSEYLRYPGVTSDIGVRVKSLGDRALVVAGYSALTAVAPKFAEGMKSAGVSYSLHAFSGYPTMPLMESLAQRLRDMSADAIIGVGGGRVMDTVKVAGNLAGVNIVTVPTVAATCAAWAAVSVVYNTAGEVVEIHQNPRSPRYVIVDPQIIALSPSRYLKAGIVDTFAKWYEFEPNVRSNQGSLALKVIVDEARLAFDFLVEHGAEAIADTEANSCTKVLSQALDAIIFLAGFSGGLEDIGASGGFAHPFYNLSTLIQETHKCLHGEKVAFGLLAQFVLEKRSREFIAEAVRLFRRFGQPTTLTEMGINDIEPVRTIAKLAVERYHPFETLGYGNEPSEIVLAILEADRLSREVIDKVYA